MPITTEKIQKLIKALHRQQLTNFIEAAEALGHYDNDAISLACYLQSVEVAK
jgi:hypothetical protein